MLRLRQASWGDLVSIKAILFSSFINSHDALFAYNFPHREKYAQDNDYFFSKLRIEPMLYESHGAVMLAETLRTDGDGSEKWVPVGLAEWEWRSRTGSIPPLACLADSWPKALGRAYLSARNYFINSLCTRRDVDVARYQAFFAAIDVIQNDYWRPRYPEALHLHALYTHSEAWGQGVGTALVEWGSDAARKSQVPVVVETASATQFYEKLGFTSVCKRRIQVDGDSNYVDIEAMVWTGTDGSN